MTIPHEPASHDPSQDAAAPQPFGLASQLGSGPAQRFVSKPATVRWGLGILWVGVVLTVVLAFVAMLLLASAGASAGSAGDGAVMGLAVTFLVLGLAIVAVQAVLLVFAGRGRGWARVALAVVSGLSLVASIAGGDGVNVGSALTIVAVVLLFLPASNEWFAAQAQGTRH